MNIQKSRFAATLTVMLMVCMMVTMFVIPASAATFEVEVDQGRVNMHIAAAEFYKLAKADLHDNETYNDLVSSVGIAQDATQQTFVSIEGNSAYFNTSIVNNLISMYNTAFPETPIEMPALTKYTNGNGVIFYRLTAPGLVVYRASANTVKLTYETTGKLVDSLGDSSLSGVLNQIIDLLPIVIPVLIGFIGLNKAIQFITGVLHSA